MSIVKANSPALVNTGHYYTGLSQQLFLLLAKKSEMAAMSGIHHLNSAWEATMCEYWCVLFEDYKTAGLEFGTLSSLLVAVPSVTLSCVRAAWLWHPTQMMDPGTGLLPSSPLWGQAGRGPWPPSPGGFCHTLATATLPHHYSLGSFGEAFKIHGQAGEESGGRALWGRKAKGAGVV